jgi:hypothetical protein
MTAVPAESPDLDCRLGIISITRIKDAVGGVLDS